MKILDFICGSSLLITPRKNAAKLVTLCIKQGIGYKTPRFVGDSFCLVCSNKDGPKALSSCERMNIEVTLKKRNSLSAILLKYKTRAGLAVGALASLGIVIFALNVVWRIDVSYNGDISPAEIKEQLYENGFCEGSYIPAADLTLIENRVVQSCPEVAWMSVNLNGTVAHVEVRATKRGESPKADPASLVAERDGKIERIQSYNGNCVVKVGDVVKKGDLLVSGIYQNEQGISRVTRASGSIFARTVREFSLEIPFENLQKVYSGRKNYEIYVNFFKKTIKIFGNSGKIPTSCDIICKNGEVGLAGFPQIPVGYRVNEYAEYHLAPVTLNESEAMELAFDALEEELKKISESVELVGKEIEFEINDRAYVLKCRLVCIEDIAAVKEIKTE